MRFGIAIALLVLAPVAHAPAAVIIVGNYTKETVTVTLTQPGEKPHEYKIPPYNVLPLPVTGPAELKLPLDDKEASLHVEPANAYLLAPDREKGLALHAVELPGKAPERDARPEVNPLPRTPIRIPVTLFVDETEPRADKLWQEEIQKRFESAAEILELQTGFKLEFAGFGTWKSDSKSTDLVEQLAVFEKEVQVKKGQMAIGYTSRKLDDNQRELGLSRGLGATHVLMREWRPKGESERLEVLVRHLAVAFGAVQSPDPGSAMRARVGDGQALRTGYVIRLDPLNALALNLLADLRRAGFTRLDDAPPADRARLIRVYTALLQAFPGDANAIEYLNVLDQEMAKADPKNPNAPKKEPLGAAEQAKRLNGVRTVVRAATARAKENTGPAALRGDELTVSLIQAAAKAALALDEPDRVGSFLLAMGIVLDETNSLGDDPVTAPAVADVETNEERQQRLAALRNPTLQGRHDLCRRFGLGCAAAEILTQTAAENSAIGRSLLEQSRPAGLSFPALSAEISGIAFGRTLRQNPDQVLKKLSGQFSLGELIAETKGLRDALSPDRFEEEFGGTDDERFRQVMTEIRKRIQAVPIAKLAQ